MSSRGVRLRSASPLNAFERIALENVVREPVTFCAISFRACAFVRKARGFCTARPWSLVVRAQALMPILSPNRTSWDSASRASTRHAFFGKKNEVTDCLYLGKFADEIWAIWGALGCPKMSLCRNKGVCFFVRSSGQLGAI